MSKLSRREFLRLVNRALATTGLAALLGPIVAYFYPPHLEEVPAEPVLVSAEADLPLGSSKTVRYGRYPALIIHTPQGLRAYSAVCTHFACIVKWDADLGQIVCPCHEGFFAASDGAVISGPPPEPLAALPLELREGEIYLGGES
jgi:cytochrome b6-f complex iron-sulfur subunit